MPGCSYFLFNSEKKVRASHGPNAPQGHGMATRWFVVVCKALLIGMVLAFCLCGAMVDHGCMGEVWCYFGTAVLCWTAKKGTIRPWAGELLWGFLLVDKVVLMLRNFFRAARVFRRTDSGERACRRQQPTANCGVSYHYLPQVSA